MVGRRTRKDRVDILDEHIDDLKNTSIPLFIMGLM
jgi:hypothetical protein